MMRIEEIAGRGLLSAAVAVLSSFATESASGATWVVGPFGQPGIDFSDPTLAANAAAAGDTILFQPGSYNTIRLPLDKPLTFVGAGANATTVYGVISGDTGGIKVRDVIFRDMKIVGWLEPVIFTLGVHRPAIYFDGGAFFFGIPTEHVLFEDCEIDSLSAAPAIGVNSSTDVNFVRCNIRSHGATEPEAGTWKYTYGGPGIQMAVSQLRFFDCDVEAGSALAGYWGSGGNGGNGCELVVSTLEAYGCSFRGGNSAASVGDGDGTGVPGHAIVLDASSVLRSQGSVFTSGLEVHPGQTPTPVAIATSPGSLVTTLPGTPALLEAPGKLTAGSSSVLTLTGEPGAHAFLLAGIQITSLPVPGYLGELFIAPPLPIVVDLGTIPPLGASALPFSVPPLGPGIESIRVVTQGVVLPAANPSAFTNPSSLTVVIPGL